MAEDERKAAAATTKTTPTTTENEKKQPLLVTYKSRLYDVAEFAARHPGGQKVLRAAAGAEVDQLLEGGQRLMGLRHEHSAAAYEILERYSLDQQFKKDPLVDGQEPVIWRVGSLGDRYWTWIHQPYDGVIRLFQTDFMERLTRTKWWMIPLIWMPLVVFFLLDGCRHLALDFGPSRSLLFGLSLFAVGFLSWTLLEYSLHRGVFHWHPDTKSPFQITLHFLLHGLHHKTPMDKDRLVFPPAAAILIVSFFYAVYRTLLPYPIFCCFTSGKLLGYICYDLSHYYLHHGRPEPNSGWHYRKVYHHNHHFKDSESGFGISTTLWDHVFGTLGAGPLL